MRDKLPRFIRAQSDWKNWKTTALIAFLLLIPTFQFGLVIDDYLFRFAVKEESGQIKKIVNKPPFFLYTFARGDQGKNEAFINQGTYLPWWASPDLKIHFLRPLSSLTIWLDNRLGLSPWMMHVHSMVWFGALLFALALFYRAVFPDRSLDAPKAAGIGFLAWTLFAVNDANMIPVAWLSHRYSMVSLTFAVLALWAHEKYRRKEGNAWNGFLLYVLALTGGETALCILGYLFARDFNRPLKLLPYGAVTLVYLVFYKAAGFGTNASGSYIDPITELHYFIPAVLSRWPALMGAQTGLITTDLWLSIPQDSWLLTAISLAGLGFFTLVVYKMRPFSDTEKWLGAGAMLSLIPLCAMFPHDRLLMISGIGLFPIIARYILRGPKGWFRQLMIVTHVFLAVIFLPLKTSVLSAGFQFSHNAIQKAPLPPPGAASRKVIVINAPSPTLGILFYSISNTHGGLGKNDFFFLISAARSSHSIRRLDKKTLEVEANFLNTEPEKIYRSNRNRLRKNQEIRLENVKIRIVKLGGDGRPRIVRFTFQEELEKYHWLYWKENEYRVLKPPAPGKKQILAEPAIYPYI